MTVPALSSRAPLRAFLVLALKIDAVNPYSVLFAIDIASSFVCTSRTLRIGPNISSLAFLSSVVVS